MRITPINTVYRNSLPAQKSDNINFGKFADKNADKRSKEHLNNMEYSALKLIKGITVYSCGDTLKFKKSMDCLKDSSKEYLYDSMIRLEGIKPKEDDLLYGERLSGLAAMSQCLLSEEREGGARKKIPTTIEGYDNRLSPEEIQARRAEELASGNIYF